MGEALSLLQAHRPYPSFLAASQASAFSTCPELSQVDAKTRKERFRIERLGQGEAVRGRGVGRPDLHSLLLRDEQPAESGNIGAIELHLLAQGFEPSRAIIRKAGQFDHKVGAEWCKTAALFGGEGLPSLQANQGDVRTERRAFNQTKSDGVIKDLPTSLLIGPEQQPHHPQGVSSAGFSAGGGHGD